MIRKIIIVMLTLGAVGTATAFSVTRHESLGVSNGRISVTATHDAVVISVATSRRSFPVRWTRRGKTDFPRWLYRPQTLHWAARGIRIIWLPFWQVFIAFSIYPTLAFIRGPLRRYRRRKRGLCVTCGYDLRGSPGRCPECGKEMAT